MTGPPRGARRAATIPLVAALLLVVALALAVPASASTWQAGLAAGSRSAARAGALTPPAPAPVGSCVSGTGTKAQVTWTSVTGVTSYSVSQATDSGTYTTVATGVTGTTWTSAALPDGANYYFKISSVRGNWASALSAASNRVYIASGNCSS